MTDEWIHTTLGEVAKLAIGRTPPREDPRYWTSDIELPFCTIADMDGWHIDPGREGVTALAEAEGKAKRVPAGSLLMSFKLTIGRVGFATRDVFPNEAIVWIEPRSSDVDVQYLAYWLDSQDLSGGAGRAVKGNTLNGQSLRSIPVTLPPLVVQRRIVDLMEHLDTHLANLETEHDAWHRTHVSLREHITAAWGEKPLKEFASIEARLVDPRDPFNARLLHIGIERIDKGTGRLLPLQTAAAEGLISSKYLFSDSDVIYSKIRPNLRKVTYPGFVGLCSADAYPLRPVPGLAPNLLCEALLLDRVVEKVVAKSGRTKMPKVNRNELFSIPVPLEAPGGVQEWREASEVLKASAQHLEVLQEGLVAASSMRQTVLELLLQGSHDLPDSYDALLAVS